MAYTISFQYMEPDDEQPSAGYEITDCEFNLPEGCHVPRVGEFIQLVKGDSANSYVVLAVQTRIFMPDPKENPGWHTYVTLGPDSQVSDQRLLIIRE